MKKNKLIFDEQNEEPNAFIFSRDDTGKSIKVTYHPERLPQDEDISQLFTKCIVGTATEKQKEKFKTLWQERVRIVLLEEVKNLFTVEKIN